MWSETFFSNATALSVFCFSVGINFFSSDKEGERGEGEEAGREFEGESRGRGESEFFFEEEEEEDESPRRRRGEEEEEES